MKQRTQFSMIVLILLIGGFFSQSCTSTLSEHLKTITEDTAKKVSDDVSNSLKKHGEDYKKKAQEAEDWKDIIMYTLLGIGGVGGAKGLKMLWDRDPNKNKKKEEV